ncbi:MAG: hypothetical protein ACI971_002151 [Colwellia sp.]|jgi:hypothetical protein
MITGAEFILRQKSGNVKFCDTFFIIFLILVKKKSKSNIFLTNYDTLKC